jgi:hypothetical protein
MGQYVHGGNRAFPVGASNISKYMRVKTITGLVVANAADLELGVVRDFAVANAAGVDVILRTVEGTMPMVANGVIAAGGTVYSAAAGKVGGATTSGASVIGIALNAAAADGDIIEVLRTN